MFTVTTANLGPLAPHLMDLAAAFAAANQPLVLIGGFGLLLRRAYREQQQAQTLLDTLPEARTTNDFDVVLGLEILTDPSARQELTAILTDLQYQVAVEYFQFIKPEAAGPNGQPVKVDFLTPLPPPTTKALRVNGVRVGPKKRQTGEPPLHAFATPELIALDAPNLTLDVAGPGSDGQPRTGKVNLPHPFTLMLMKLHAFMDEHNGKRDLGSRPMYARKHALDVLTLAALLTPEESDQLPQLRAKYEEHPAMHRAKEIVDEYFNSTTAVGTGYLQPLLQAQSPDEVNFLDLLLDTYGSVLEHQD